MEEMEWNGIERGNSIMADRCTFHAHKQVDTLRWKKWNGIKIHKMEGGGGGVVILKVLHILYVKLGITINETAGKCVVAMGWSGGGT